jgi:hypothetical protein
VEVAFEARRGVYLFLGESDGGASADVQDALGLGWGEYFETMSREGRRFLDRFRALLKEEDHGTHTAGD